MQPLCCSWPIAACLLFRAAATDAQLITRVTKWMRLCGHWTCYFELIHRDLQFLAPHLHGSITVGQYGSSFARTCGWRPR